MNFMYVYTFVFEARLGGMLNSLDLCKKQVLRIVQRKY